MFIFFFFLDIHGSFGKFVGFGQACPGMPNLQNNKMPTSLERVELFRLFVVCSYTSMEATVLCHVGCIWSCMRKVL